MGKTVLVKPCADYAKLARDVGDAVANALFAGNVVEMDPLSVLRHNDTLCTENHPEFARHEFVEAVLDSRECEFIGGLNAPAREYVVGVVMTVVMVVMVMAVAIRIVTFVIVVMVMMLVLVAVTLMIVVVMMLMVMTFALGIIAFVIVMMTVLMMIVMLVHKLVQTFLKRILAFCR